MGAGSIYSQNPRNRSFPARGNVKDLTHRTIVAMACDQEYLYPWAVSLFSASHHSHASLDVWFGLATDWQRRLGQHDLDNVIALVESTGSTVTPVDVSVDTTGLPSSSYISPTAFVKMGLFDLCPADAEMVWLDSDLIIRRPWLDVVDLSRGHAVSGAHEFNPSFEDLWPSDSRDWYVNTGVVVVSGELWHSTYAGAWKPLLLRYSEHDFRYMDQDVLNAAIRDGWNLLPQTYNFRPIHMAEWSDPVVVHFAGRYKPWMSTPLQYRLLRGAWRPSFDAYFEAEQLLVEHLESHVGRAERDYWRDQRRRTRGRAGNRAWRYYGKVLTQGAFALN